MVGSLLRAAFVDSGYQEASMDAGGPNGQPFERVQPLLSSVLESGLAFCNTLASKRRVCQAWRTRHLTGILTSSSQYWSLILPPAAKTTSVTVLSS